MRQLEGKEDALRYITSLIRYRCANPDHQHQATTSLADTMTIHEQAWAYCPRNVRVPGHAWTLANPRAPVLVRAPADLPALG